jgi:hypothetical protein
MAHFTIECDDFEHNDRIYRISVTDKYILDGVGEGAPDYWQYEKRISAYVEEYIEEIDELIPVTNEKYENLIVELFSESEEYNRELERIINEESR